MMDVQKGNLVTKKIKLVKLKSSSRTSEKLFNQIKSRYRTPAFITHSGLETTYTVNIYRKVIGIG